MKRTINACWRRLAVSCLSDGRIREWLMVNTRAQEQSERRNSQEAGGSTHSPAPSSAYMWKVEHQARQNVIRVTVAGAVSSNDLTGQLDATMTLLRRYKVERGLVDYSLADVKISVADLYLLPDKLIAAGMPKTVKIAVVFPETRYQIETYEFVENVMTHRGFDVRLFTTAESAMSWLTAGIKVHWYDGPERRMRDR